MEPALSSTILKFPHFFPASLQAKTVGISKLLMIRLVPSFKLKTKYLYDCLLGTQCTIFKWHFKAIIACSKSFLPSSLDLANCIKQTKARDKMTSRVNRLFTRSRPFRKLSKECLAVVLGPVRMMNVDQSHCIAVGQSCQYSFGVFARGHSITTKIEFW